MTTYIEASDSIVLRTAEGAEGHRVGSRLCGDLREVFRTGGTPLPAVRGPVGGELGPRAPLCLLFSCFRFLPPSLSLGSAGPST